VSGGWSGAAERRKIQGSAVSLCRFNRLSPDEAAELLRSCLNVDRWVRTICKAAGRPDTLFQAARQAAHPSGPELEAALAVRHTLP
jgi:hypothetical protein